MADRTEDLIEAYEVLSDLTRPLCDACPSPPGDHRCCFSQACEIAAMVARLRWSAELGPGDHASGLPFLAPDGCTVAPHHRPACTGYLCPDALSQAPVDTQREYHDIRAYIARLEMG